jgi:hypothetical protein
MMLQGEEEEGEVYEVLNIRTLKQATPNLRKRSPGFGC